ncbi:MAG: insulinase family protein, partial [Myxococcota bacterium]
MLQLRGRAIAWAGIFMLAACQPPTPNGKTSVSKSDIEKAIPPAMGSEREAEKTKAKAEPAGEKAAKVEAAAEPTQSEVEKVEAAGDAPAVAEKAPEEEEAKAPEAASEPLLAASKGEVMGLPYMQADLPNGLRAIAVRTDTPDVVSLQIAVRTGSRNEVEPGKSGFAHFFEHMMFRGTEKYPPDVYLDILKKAGADQNAYTSDDLTNYHITFTKADLDQVLEVESDRFQNLAYTEDQFRTEALAVKGEYLKNYSNPVRKMFERIRSLAFTTHPYRHTTLGFV